MELTVTLREWESSDAEQLLLLRSQDPELEHQIQAASTIEEASNNIAQSYRVSTEGMVWCLDVDGRACALVGITYSGTGQEATYDRGWVYYWAAHPIRGQGIMQAAVHSICDFAQGHAPQNLMRKIGKNSLNLTQLKQHTRPQLRRLELGYRLNNTASRALALSVGFVEEGIEREKFSYRGVLYDAAIASRLRTDIGRSTPKTPTTFLHHLELWTRSFSTAYPSWQWLAHQLGLQELQRWEKGISWQAQDGSYLVLEESPDTQGEHNRLNPGMNHVAFNCSREVMEKIRGQLEQSGWQELFATKYPHAAGKEHFALYINNAEGFEVELVAKQ